MKTSVAARFASRRITFIASGAACVALAFAASAQATVSAPPITGSFAYHETDTPDGRCGWGWGLQFTPIKGVKDYSWDYYDGYWNSDFDGDETSAEFLAETYSTPTEYFHGITGGTGPQPCTSGGANDNGRFPKPPTISPIYPDGKNPPLNKTTSSAKPASAGHAVLQAASGTFPVGATATVDITLKSAHALTGFRITHLHAPGATVVLEPELESLVIPAHTPQPFTAEVEGKRAGRVKLSITFSGRYTTGKSKKSTKATITTTSSLVFGNS